MLMNSRRKQRGSFMLEALIGIVIFFLGVLTMIALQASSIAIQTDSQYRAEASNLVDQILGQINLNSRNAPPPAGPSEVNPVTLASFSHRPARGVGSCRLHRIPIPWPPPTAATSPDLASANRAGDRTGSPPSSTDVGDASAVARTPSTAGQRQQIVVNPMVVGTTTFDQVIVTVCWQGPKDARPRFHRAIGYVN
jgi:type II secretory pathway pseudopilin PulG